MRARGRATHVSGSDCMWCEHDMGSCTHVAEQGKGTQGVGSDCMWCELHEWREVRAGCLECEGLCKVWARRNGVCAISLHQWLRSLYARVVREPSRNRVVLSELCATLKSCEWLGCSISGCARDKPAAGSHQVPLPGACYGMHPFLCQTTSPDRRVDRGGHTDTSHRVRLGWERGSIPKSDP